MAGNESLFLQMLADRILVFDGAMGTSLHTLDLPLSDYRDLENCSEILNETRPDAIEQIHRSFLDIGCDAIETNTFGANRFTLDEFGLGDQTYALNLAAAGIGRRAVEEYLTPRRPRFVVGSIGPGRALPSLRQVSYDDLLDSYREQVRGLLDGGVDVLLIETCQDILQAKTAIHAVRLGFEECQRSVPLICSITMETTGTMLMGTEVAAALTTLEAFPDVDVIGLNCATGPQEMSEHVRYLSRHCSRFISVLPNAGLPHVVEGQAHFPLLPDELARWLRTFVETDGVNVVGGCCGTTPEHLKAVVQAVEALAPRQRELAHEPSVSSLYGAVTMRQETSFLIVGERCNANGSTAFRRQLKDGDVESIVEMGSRQIAEGAHVLDVCVDSVGRDGATDMARVIDRFAADLTAPLMLDSTQTEVIEAGLKLAGGKCMVNSVTLEDGGAKLEATARLLRQYGAAVVALTIDEDPEAAMARTCSRKVDIARRLHTLLTKQHGITEEDVFFDCLTFPIGTGSPEDRRLALETLDAIEALALEFPRCHFILGISNVSFGLAPAARVVLNSVFLQEALRRGLTAAIVHAGKILPQNQISPERWQAALDLIYDRQNHGAPLERYLELFDDGMRISEPAPIAALPVEQRLRRRIIDGRKHALELDLDEALRTQPALEIINNILLDAMKEVGDLFGAGRMQLPFVLKSAETMKAAVRHLEPHLDRASTGNRGKIVLATVRGDVHDIGKNLADIILSNNGFAVYNLGIKQPIGNVITAWREHDADVIGLSGLLVKSTMVMQEDLEHLNEQGITAPVILGGAALNRKYVEGELRSFYKGDVHYAKDVFEGLRIMNEVMSGKAIVGARAAEEPEPVLARVSSAASIEQPHEEEAKRSDTRRAEPAGDTSRPTGLPVDTSVATPTPIRELGSDLGHEYPVPYPPFWGTRVLEKVELKSVLAYLNEKMLFQVQWGIRGRSKAAERSQAYSPTEARAKYRELVTHCENEGILQPRAVYGYWPANSDGDDLIIFAPPRGTIQRPEHHGPEIARFRFPRQQTHPYWCLADFWRPISAGVPDLLAGTVVTAGPRVSEAAHRWLEEGRYEQYFLLHGLGVELAEALAKYLHKLVRVDLGVAGQDARERQKLFQQGYQGCRYSFGYPACPNLEDQEDLLRLLDSVRIGVSLTETCQLEPEQSTSAIITYHPKARYFSV